MSVGVNIRKRRYELRMSQQELADAMGYKTRSTIAKIESGENDVSQKKLRRFAEVLETTVEALVSEYGTATAPAADPGRPTGRRRHAVIVLAGGRAGQNRQNVPTQFVHVGGKPLLVYSMDAYQAHPSIDDIYVVCLKGWESIVSAYAGQYGITKLRGLIPAGGSGVASLKNAIDRIRDRYDPEDLILIQESTRPLVRVETISRLLQACADKDSATIGHAMREHIQFYVAGGRTGYVDRDAMITLQSPEAHRLGLLDEVFQKAAARNHPLTETCCTMLLYNLGYPINFIEGTINNSKIAREEDLAAFSALVNV